MSGIGIMGGFPPDSPLGRRLQMLYDLAAQFRGPILDQLVFIDIGLTDYLSTYFAPEEDRRSALADDLITEMSLERKIDLFAKYGPENGKLIQDLDTLRGVRNDLAHGTPDTSDPALEMFEASGEVTFVVKTKKGLRTRCLSGESVRQHLSLCSKCVHAIADATDSLRRSGQ